MFNLGNLLPERLRMFILSTNLGRKLVVYRNRKTQSPDYSIINFSRYFDREYYLKLNRDVERANLDPLDHYIRYGVTECRNPNKWFHTLEYAAINRKYLSEDENPFVHFITKGLKLGLPPKFDYEVWVKWYDTITEEDLKSIRTMLPELSWKPTISVVMPVYNPPITYFRIALDSVLDQLYPHWELCIADDHSTDPKVRKVLEEYQKKDPRIKVAYRKKNGHISAASNSALELATGDFAALLDHDDKIPSHALFTVALALNENPEAEMIYSDEDKVDENDRRYDPYFKSDWNRDLLYSQNCISHLGVYKLTTLRKIGGFREGFEGSQDYDLALRFIEKVEEKNIVHLPYILYHWRSIRGSAAYSIEEKSYALEAGVNALDSHFERTNQPAKSEVVLGLQYRVRWQIPSPQPLISIIIPFRDKVELLKTCLHGLLKQTDYQNFEILLIDNESQEPETLTYLDSLKDNPRIKTLPYKDEFNFAAITNYGVSQCKGQLLCFLNNDIEVINPEWLTEMISQALRPEVGAVGAKLYYDDDTIQHGGVILGVGGIAGHLHKYSPRKEHGYMCRASLAQDLSAVTAACMVLRREVFEEVGGMDQENLKIAFNDIDLCLKIRDNGYLIVYTPFAELYHHESKSRGHDTEPSKVGRFRKEMDFMEKKWNEVLKNDPYFNLNFSLYSENFHLAYPPRITKPWKKKVEAPIQ